MSDAHNELESVQQELAEATGRPAPQYNLIAATPSGRMLGAVTLAHGLTEDLDDACGRVQRFFSGMPGVSGGVNVRPISIEEGKRVAADLRGMMAKPKMQVPPPRVSLDQVLMDVKNATDCCVFTVADYCVTLPSVKPESEVACTYCNSYFRYTNDGDGNYAWIWMLPKKYVRSEREIFSVKDAYEAAKARLSQRDREEAVAKFDFGVIDTPGEASLPKPLRVYPGSEVGDKRIKLAKVSDTELG